MCQSRTHDLAQIIGELVRKELKAPMQAIFGDGSFPYC
ncbi:hypothetical protein TREAZ_3245 [Leadbettera azotonutricia ZAS-9]|uniref:Uncharacterized protein n=1 Tax=Leadbettera azotonutricia (strain ATCC BAA-888 / DSM 13862 / ZAS-9) TaxID=545695 RepID=F5Y975_LEAAZ|nr:hypothetical protein TREAZ_3245 [Leadbettera azotonutricia ZAS-9]